MVSVYGVLQWLNIAMLGANVLAHVLPVPDQRLTARYRTRMANAPMDSIKVSLHAESLLKCLGTVGVGTREAE
jgi:hypothetical protein